LAQFAEYLQTVESFDAESLDTALHAFCEQAGIKIGQIIHALRVATTGQAVGFGMFETLAILGREETLARLRQSQDLSE